MSWRRPRPILSPSLEGRLARRRQRHRERQLLTGVVTRDPRTGGVRHGRAEIADGCCVLWLPKRLMSPNRSLATHWTTKLRARKAWARVIRLAVADTMQRPTIAAFETPALALGWTPPVARVRVHLERRAPTRRHLLTDRDNLFASVKGVVDAVVRAGFVEDDRDAAIDLQVTQTVSPDGLDWTVVTIAPLAAAPLGDPMPIPHSQAAAGGPRRSAE